ncbi:MAG: hypothetical protein ABI222_16905 [Opitutaceae bacterium]
MKTIKILIWTYIVLLLVEGALRKWFLPSLADPLLVVRDPVLLAIYAMAVKEGIFPNNRFVLAIAVLAVLSTAAFVLAGNNQYLILVYGLRIDYLHLPLIWIMGRVLTVRDVGRIGAFLLVVAIPMTLIMIQQFHAPMDAFINRGVSKDEIGQIFGAEGRIRPPGLFSFITGPQLYFPLCAAFFFDELSGTKRLPWYVLIASGLAIAIALPISISRTVMLSTAIVAGVFLITLPLASARVSALVRPIFLLVLVVAGLSQLPIFRQSVDVFMVRWDTAAETESSATAWESIADRSMGGFLTPYYYMKAAPWLGHGIGMGSNVAARLTAGGVGFTLAEEEWGKVILELGPVLGAAFIIFRFVLTGWLGLKAWRALRQNRQALPILIFSATAIIVLQGQWAPPTILGFCVVGSGLLLGALNPAPAAPNVAGGENPSEPDHPVRPDRIRVPRPSDRRAPTVGRPARNPGGPRSRRDGDQGKINRSVNFVATARMGGVVRGPADPGRTASSPEKRFIPPWVSP